MPSLTLDIDELRLASSEEELAATLNCSVMLQTGNESFDTLSNSELIERLTSGTVWVSRGAGYRVDFVVSENGQPLLDHDVSEKIGRYLQAAPLWSQLQMDVELDLPKVKDDGDTHAGFSLLLRHALPAACETTAETVSSPVAAALQVPDTISSLELQKIMVLIEFNSPFVWAEGPLRRPSPFEAGVRFDGAGNVINGVGFPVGAGSQQAWYNGCSSSTDFVGVEFLDTIHDSPAHSQEADNTSSYPGVDALNYGSHSPHIQSPLRTSSPFSYLADDTEHASTKSSSTLEYNLISRVQLAEAGLRHLIGGRPTKTEAGVSLLEPRPTQTLAQIAPALWCPGYMQVISERTRYVDLISSSLLRVLGTAQSPDLQRQFATLALTGARNQSKSLGDNATAEDGDGPRDAHRLDKDAHDTVIQGYLWRMMQLSLYDPLSARRLHPAAGFTTTSAQQDPHSLSRSMVKDKEAKIISEEGGSSNPGGFRESPYMTEVFQDLLHELMDDEEDN